MLTKQELSLNELMVFSSELRRAEKSVAIAYRMCSWAVTWDCTDFT